MKTIVKLLLPMTLLIGTATFANDQAKIAVVKKAFFAGEVSPYATPSFKQLLAKARKIDDRMAKHPDYEPMGCEFAEHYYLGHGNGGPERSDFKNLKFSVTKNGDVQTNFSLWGDKVSLRFKVVCQGNRCLIDDLDDLKSDAKKMISTNTCID